MGSSASVNKEKTHADCGDTKINNGQNLEKERGLHGNNTSRKYNSTFRTNGNSDINDAYESDSDSYNSGDSDDTIVLAARMPKYLAAESIEEGNEKNNENVQKKEDDVDEDAIIEEIAMENHASQSKEENPYELDTIGYYISKGNSDQKEPTESEADNKNENSNSSKTINKNDASVDKDDGQNEEGKTKSKDEAQDRFELFKKIYGKKMSKGRKPPPIANKHTLVLVKIGTQYKYVAVPAYLPGQKMVTTRSITNKGFIERAEHINKVKPLPKCKYTLCFKPELTL